MMTCNASTHYATHQSNDNISITRHSFGIQSNVRFDTSRMGQVSNWYFLKVGTTLKMNPNFRLESDICPSKNDTVTISWSTFFASLNTRIKCYRPYQSCWTNTGQLIFQAPRLGMNLNKVHGNCLTQSWGPYSKGGCNLVSSSLGHWFDNWIRYFALVPFSLEEIQQQELGVLYTWFAFIYGWYTF